jgi:hypothetical protein
LHPARLPHLQRGSCCLARLLDASLAERPVSGKVLLIGLTESGIVPSFLMYLEACRLSVQCRWICSTRRPCSCGIAFQETHSHGPNHTLPIPEDNFSEIWIVEDEITTGRTVQSLLKQLRGHVTSKVFRIFSLMDFRSEQQRKNFQSFLKKQAKAYFFHTAFSSAGIQNRQEELPCNPNEFIKKNQPSVRYPEQLFRQSVQACGLQWNQLPANAANATLLVLGEAVHTAVLLVAAGKFRSFQHITLSPWLVDNQSIESRTDLPGNYYLYNTTMQDHLRSPIFLLHDPADQAMSSRVHSELEEQGIPVQQLLFS